MPHALQSQLLIRLYSCPVFQFPPEFDVGDATKVKMRLPNHVYNKLKRHSAAEEKRAQRLHEKKEHSTAVSDHIAGA